MEKIVVLSGAGISAESGIKTFRDAGGLWEGHDVMTVASPEGWRANPELVLDFYNQRRRQLHEVAPNLGHQTLVELQTAFDVSVITQNVDDLHERAGSSKVLHLHGELLKARSTENERLIYDWKEDLLLGHTCEEGHQLRPHIVWFGEAVPMIELAVEAVMEANVVIVVGSSMQVYPAAGLVGFARQARKVFYVDPNPAINYELARFVDLVVLDAPATEGLPEVARRL